MISDPCAVAGCENIALGPLCDAHVERLRQNRLRAEVLRLTKLRRDIEGHNRLLPDRDPLTIVSGDYLPLALRPGHSRWEAHMGNEIAQSGPPILRAIPCDIEKCPTTLRSALKLAAANSWDTQVTIAISHDDITSYLFRARKDDIILASRHEAPLGKPTGFRIAWLLTPGSFPVQLGWREMTACLSGTDPRDVAAEQMKQAVLTCIDAGMTLVEVIA